MSTYKAWELLNEAVGGQFSLGLKTHNSVGGLVGAHNFQEGPVDLGDDEEDEDEGYEDEDEDEGDDFDSDEDEDGDYEEIDADDEGDDEETDLLGDTPEGPEKGFPPDDSESMDGLPTPDEEMLGGDEMPADPGEEGMDDVLAGIDPELAGLGGDEMGAAPGGEELEPGAGDEMGPMGDMEDMGMGMGGEEGAADEPCPECNPDGEMEDGDGDPECEFCGGQGYVTADQADMPEDPGAVDAEIVDEDPDSEMMELMARMQAYCQKYMPQFSGKFMDKDGPTYLTQRDAQREMQARKAGVPGPQYGKNAHPDYQPQDQYPKHSRKYMSKGCDKGCRKSCCKENTEFVNSLTGQAKGNLRQYRNPKPGQPGFAPQGRVGAVGGGYTQADINGIPVLGESANYKTWKSFLRGKKK